MSDIITIDGTTYDVKITSLVQSSEFAEKYCERTESYNLQRELAGIFYNYQLTLGDNQDEAVMRALWAKLHEFTEYHTVKLPHDGGFLTFQAYITGTSRKLLKRVDGNNKWGGFVIEFLAKAPQITG